MTKQQKITAGHEGHYKEVTISLADNEPEVWGAEREYTLVGKKRIPRLDALEKVTGKAKYTHDINLPNMLHAVLVTSPHAKARVNSVDTSEAQTMPGVVAVEVIPGIGTANYAGTVVAVVAAETIQQARDAARKVKVDFEPSSFQVIPEKPKEDNNTPGRIRPTKYQMVGDVEGIYAVPTASRGAIDQGFRQADVIAEGTYTTPITPHQCLETHGSVAEWKNNQLTAWTSTQALWLSRSDAANAGQASISQTRLICQHMGGGFGSKFGLENYDGIGIRIAKKTGRPVKIMADRWVDATVCGYKPGAIMDVRVGAKQDGQLTAMSLKTYAITAQNGSIDAPMLDGYTCPNVSTSTSNLSLNIVAPRAFRAPGRPQGTFALELALEELAVNLDMDPLDLRLKNVSSHATDARESILEIGAERSDWRSKFQKHGTSPGPIKRGIGLAMCTWNYGSGANTCTVRCTIHKDGSVEIATGTQDLGTGNRTAMAIVAAESLGIEVNRIHVSIGDTDIGLEAPVSWGSISTGAIAPAVRTATYQAQRRVFEPIAELWNTTVDDLHCQSEIVSSKTNPQTTMSWEQVAATITGTAGRVPGPPMISVMSSNRHLSAPGVNTGAKMRGAQFAEVEVDTVTGMVRCTKIVAVHECGKTMAKAQAESQICGGVIMGASFALTEEWILDPTKGRPMNANMENYKILGISETPEIEPVLIDVYDPINCACAKGLGEPPHIPTAAAIGCAVYNALGVPIRELPITPYKVLQALQL
ncbi:MAG: xanthine dehydrogenase family protein molybdopterin-binding subunit [Planctomycetota bacterium]|jgi:xanthine dehydrogenase YagR molybdenum-binding subunit